MKCLANFRGNEIKNENRNLAHLGDKLDLLFIPTRAKIFKSRYLLRIR